MYNNVEDQSIPSSFALVAGYEPELYYFMRYRLNFTEKETEIQSENAGKIFDDDPTSMQTLLNPGNLQFFYEKYKQGDLHAISSRFSSNKTESAQFTVKQVEAIYQYLVFISERELSTGPFGNSTFYKEHQAYGSLLSKAFKVSYQHIYSTFQDWYLPTFFAAFNDKAGLTCSSYLNLVLPNATNNSSNSTINVTAACQNRSVTDPAAVKEFVLAMDDPTAQQKLSNETNLTTAEVA